MYRIIGRRHGRLPDGGPRRRGGGGPGSFMGIGAAHRHGGAVAALWHGMGPVERPSSTGRRGGPRRRGGQGGGQAAVEKFGAA